MSEELFPLTSKYDLNWIRKNSYDGLTLHCLESLCQIMPLERGMRVLDLGCGWAISSIFLANEFDVQVWAVDVEKSPSENYQRVLEAECDDHVFPVWADARDLPFPENFFDAVISIDAYSYFGLDERYPAYLLNYLKPGGLVGIVDGCFTREICSISDTPDYLRKLYLDDEDPWYAVHSISWWRNYWEKAGLAKVLTAEILPQNDYIWQEYINNCRNQKGEQTLINALLNDSQNLIAMFRMVARSRL